MSDVPEVPFLADFDFICATALENFIIACKPLGQPLITLSQMVQEAFQTTKELMIYGLQHPEPQRGSCAPRVMERYSEIIASIVDYKNPHKEVKNLENHQSMIKEGISTLLFMKVKPAPVPYMKEMIDASQYYGNRVLTQNKGKENHILFVTKHNELWSDLHQFVKKHFLTGFTWNTKPKSALGNVSAPPPPPPPPMQAPIEKTESSGDAARVALLQQLNQGSDITRNLKPVKKGGVGASQPVKENVSSVDPQGKKLTNIPKAQPEKFCLDGKKWKVEYFKGNHDMVIENSDMSESVSCYKLDDSSVVVKNKVNYVVVDSCIRAAINIGSVISSVELIRCKRVRIKIDGVVPLINLENCDEVQIFLSSKSRDVEIISSKSSASNVCLLEDDGNYVELPMPEQIKTVLAGNRLVSSVVEKY